jgi:hypothetical protein
MTEPAPVPDVLSLVLTLRGKRVLLDSDLARLYGVPTKRLNEQVRRNVDKFPGDFAFQLTREEVTNLKSQFATSSSEDSYNQGISSASHGGRRKLQWAFTDYGAIQAANVLNSPAATAMSIYVVRTFAQMRETLLTSTAILKRLAEIDKTLIEHDGALRAIWHQLQPLLQPPPEPPKRRIGFPS